MDAMDGMDKINGKIGSSWGIPLLCAIPLAVSILFAQRRAESPNVSSRMDTVQSLVERGTFCIDQSLRVFEVDVVKIDGRFFSDKPPLLSVAGAAIYWPLHQVAGLSFAKHAPWLYHILTVLLIGLPAALGVWLLAQCLRLADVPDKTIRAAVFLAATGTIILPYSVTFSNHVPAATAIMAAMYCVMKAKRGPSTPAGQTSELLVSSSLPVHGEGRGGGMQASAIITPPPPSPWTGREKEGDQDAGGAGWCAAAGATGALALNLDLSTGGTALAGFGVLAAMQAPRFRNAMAYGAGAAGPLALYFFLNWLVTGDLKPIYLHSEYYDYPGSVLRSADGMKRLFGTNIASQWFHMTLGYRGFFLHSPILLFGLIEAVRRAVRREAFGPFAWVTLAILLLAGSSYAIQITDLSGGSYGMRWLLPTTLLLAFYAALAMQRLQGRRGRLLLGAAAGFSIAVAALGVPRPWSSNIRSPIPFLDNLAYFAQTLWPPAKPPVYWIVESTSLEKGYAYLEIGRWHMNHQFYPAAVADLERARARDPSRSNLIDYYLGICHDASGSPDLAVEAYERLLAREPENTGAWNNYAQSLRRMGLRAQALAALRKSLAMDPNKVFTLRALGQLCWEMGSRDDAVKHWERALEIAPEQPDVRALLAEAYRQVGKSATPPEQR